MFLTDEERLQYRLEPTPAVVEAAWDTIHAHEAAIGEIEDRIQGLLNQVRDLQYDQAKHRAAIERTKGLVTLARRLPEELLIKIFRHCVEDGQWTRAPIVVSHVCAAWRRAAHAPQVWAHVYAKLDDALVLDRTRFWLAMARGLAGLHVTVVSTWRVPTRPIMEVMDVLVERSAQWRSLRIETDSLRHADLMLELCRRPLPELREVEIRTTALDSADPEGTEVADMADRLNAEVAPRLTRVAYVSTVVPAAPIFPSHITDLVLEIKESPTHRPLSATAIIDIIERLPELRKLSLSMPLIYEHEIIPAPDADRIASLPSLTSLALYGPTDLNELLPHLRTPSLRELYLRSLEDLGYRQRPIGPSLTRYIHSSSPPLELLELHDIDLDPGAFQLCFGALPALRELRLHESSISDATVQLLHGPRGLCPRLARLDFRWCGHLHGRALVELVRSRHVVDDLAGPVADPIAEVGVINCCFVTEDDVLDLARMTVCRLVTREADDYCRSCGCCTNQRYRTRLRMRHISELVDRKGDIRLIL